jgi:Clp amino terminal domain, pathogenicity island component
MAEGPTPATCFVTGRVGRQWRGVVRASASGGKRISQNEFTEKAWQAVVAAPEIAKSYSQQIVETEHLFKALLEQPNGLARRIASKAGSNPTTLLDKTDAFIRKQPRVSGDASQVTVLHLLCGAGLGWAERGLPMLHCAALVCAAAGDCCAVPVLGCAPEGQSTQERGGLPEARIGLHDCF